MGNRTVFTLAAILMVLFFAISNYDRYFFLLHFLEAAIYVVILLLLFYGLEDWAYTIGFVAPLLWIVLSLVVGMSLAGLEALVNLVTFQAVANPADLLAGLIFLAALGLMVASGWAFYREVWGRPEAWRAAVGGILVAGIYYAALIRFAYSMASPPD